MNREEALNDVTAPPVPLNTHTPLIPNKINQLPDELIFAIFQYLSDLDLMKNCQFVCKKWYGVAHEFERIGRWDEIIWMAQLKRQDNLCLEINNHPQDMADLTYPVSKWYSPYEMISWSVHQNAILGRKWLPRQNTTWFFDPDFAIEDPPHLIIKPYALSFLAQTENFVIFKKEENLCLIVSREDPRKETLVYPPRGDIIGAYSHRGEKDTFSLVIANGVTMTVKAESGERIGIKWETHDPSHRFHRCQIFEAPPFICLYETRSDQSPKQIYYHTSEKQFQEMESLAPLFLNKEEETSLSLFDSFTFEEHPYIFEIEYTNLLFDHDPKKVLYIFRLYSFDGFKASPIHEERMEGSNMTLIKFLTCIQDRVYLISHDVNEDWYHLHAYDIREKTMCYNLLKPLKEPPQFTGNFILINQFNDERNRPQIIICHIPSGAKSCYTLNPTEIIISSYIREHKLYLLSYDSRFGPAETVLSTETHD